MKIKRRDFIKTAAVAGIFPSIQSAKIINANSIDENKLITNYNFLPESSKIYLDGLKLGSGEEIYHLLLFTNEEIKGYADDAKVITDDNLILEFSTAKQVLNQNPTVVIEDINNFLENE